MMYVHHRTALLLCMSAVALSVPLAGNDHYYRILSVGLNEKLDPGMENRRSFQYLRPDFNPYAIQEVKTSISISCFIEAQHIDEEVFTVTCPSGCGKLPNQVWGSGIYTDHSAICQAAIHDGVIEADRGGAVSIRKIEGKNSYKGSTVSGITSRPHGPSPTSMIFQNAGKARRPTYEVSCVVQANWIRDSDFNIICPAGCGVVADNLWGDGTYSDASYLCAAAIHNGTIKDTFGGEVHVMKTGYQDSFEGSTMNDLTSYESNVERESFELDKVGERASMMVEVSCYFQADHVAEDVFTVRCPPGCDKVSDQVFGTGIYTRDSFLCASAIHAGRIRAPMGGVVTVYKTSGKITFIGSLRNAMASTGKEFGEPSFIFQDTTVREPEIATVACELRGDHLRDDVATVICPKDCDHREYQVWGTSTYTSNSYICASAAHAGMIDVSIGGPVTVKRVPGLPTYLGTTSQRIISKSSGPSDKSFILSDFMQKTGSVLAVKCDFTADLMNDNMFSISCPTGCSKVGNKVWGDGIYTSDSPLCTAAMHDGYIKDLIGGVVTVHKVDGLANYGEATRNGIQSFSYRSWSRSSVIFQRPSMEAESVFPVTCETRANFIVDDTAIAVCPAGCDWFDSVWGTGVYTDDSFICAAAIHDGRINADEGGQVIIAKVPGLAMYTGSTSNKITSMTKSKWRKSIIFRDAVEQRVSTYTITCDVEGSMILDEEYAIVCPPGCKEDVERVWGTNVYTEDSYICASALHAGKISDSTGGQVLVMSTEANKFRRSTRNGITSKLYDKSAKAFKFL